MLKSIRPFLYFTLSLLLLVSCTMQKRLHNPGYSVAWNKKYSAPASQQKPVEFESVLTQQKKASSVEKTEKIVVQENSFSESISMVQPIEENNPTNDEVNVSIEDHSESVTNEVKEHVSKSFEDEEKIDEEARINYFGTVFSSIGFGLSMLGILIFVILMITGGGLFLLASLLFGAVGVGLSAYGFSLANKNNRWGRIGGLLGIILGGLLILMLLVMFIALIAVLLTI